MATRKPPRDGNGNPLYARPRRLSDGKWAALAWANGAYTPDHIGVRIYRTREDAYYGTVDGTLDVGADAAQEAEYWSIIESELGYLPYYW